jgi:hypothetical protein
MRSLNARAPTDSSASADAVTLRRWFAIASVVPWLVMGWGVEIGGIPSIWYYFRPQDHNPFVMAWFGTIVLLTVYFAFWVFFLGGAERVVSLKPIEINWYRTSFRGTARGTLPLTVGRVRFIAAIGPIWVAAWIYVVSLMNAQVPK